MSKYIDRAKALRAIEVPHYNCAQAVVVPFAEEAGLSEQMAMAICSNFGRGMKRAAACGAITGGLVVLGMFGIEIRCGPCRYHCNFISDRGGVGGGYSAVAVNVAEYNYREGFAFNGLTCGIVINGYNSARAVEALVVVSVRGSYYHVAVAFNIKEYIREFCE